MGYQYNDVDRRSGRTNFGFFFYTTVFEASSSGREGPFAYRSVTSNEGELMPKKTPDTSAGGNAV